MNFSTKTKQELADYILANNPKVNSTMSELQKSKLPEKPRAELIGLARVTQNVYEEINFEAKTNQELADYILANNPKVDWMLSERRKLQFHKRTHAYLVGFAQETQNLYKETNFETKTNQELADYILYGNTKACPTMSELRKKSRVELIDLVQKTQKFLKREVMVNTSLMDSEI